jgi:very-short-patch-repair endonuclease
LDEAVVVVAPDCEAPAMEPEDLVLASIAGANDGVFTLEHARLAGLTDRQIEYRAEFVWERRFAGVYRFPGAPETWMGNVRAACLAGEPNAVLSHRTGATFYGLPGGRTDIIEMTCPRWRRTQTHGLIVHESALIDPGDVQLVDDLPVMRPERVVFELASIYRSPNYIERVLLAARRQRLITYESTHATFERLQRRGRPGVAVFREALGRWRPDERPTDSEMETTLLQVMRKRGLPEPVLQYEVFDPSGRFVGRLDAALPDHRVLIEYDSRQEHSDEWALTRDARQRNRLTALGYRVLVARHADLKAGGSELAAAIRACMRSAPDATGVSFPA